MELRQLKYFVSLAQTGTFSEAAERVHVSQPALSQQIKKLEEELDTLLFERMGKTVKLTEQGENFLSEAMNVLDSVRSAYSSVKAGHNSKPTHLKLGIIPTIAPYFLPEMMNQLDADSNELNINIEEQQTERLLKLLKIGDVDHLLLSPPIPDKELRTKTIGHEPFYLAVSENDRIASRTSVSVEEIDEKSLLILEEGHCLRDQSLNFCKNQEVEPNVRFQGSSLQSVLNLVETGYGYTFVPEMVVKNQEDRSLEFVPFTNPKPNRGIMLVRRKSTELNQSDRAFYHIVERWFQNTIDKQ